MMTEAEIRKMRRCYTSGSEGRGHEQRNAGGLQKLGKTRDGSLLEPPGRT